MLDHKQLIPAEREAENQLLIEDLSRYFDTQAEDRASLASIRARLLQKTATALPVIEKAREIEMPVPLPIHREKNTRMKLIHAVGQNRARHPYLNTLVAAALLVLLVGSFALIASRRGGTTTGSFPRSSAPAVAHDWSILTSFVGAGNKTMDDLDIEVGHKYGWLISCTNTLSGVVSVTINGNDSGGTNCAIKTPGPLAPQSSSSTLSSGGIGLPPILTIDVKATASTSWKLWLFEGTYYPPLSMFDPDFHSLHDEMDGTGNMTVVMDVTIPATAWILGFECHGTGTFKIGLWSNPDSATTDITENENAPCDGQPTVDQFDNGYLHGTVIHQIRITTGPDNDWQVVLAGCTNTQPSCGVETVNPTVTP